MVRTGTAVLLALSPGGAPHPGPSRGRGPHDVMELLEDLAQEPAGSGPGAGVPFKPTVYFSRLHVPRSSRATFYLSRALSSPGVLKEISVWCLGQEAWRMGIRLWSGKAPTSMSLMAKGPLKCFQQDLR